MNFSTPREAIIKALKHHKRYKRTNIDLNRSTVALQKELIRVSNRVQDFKAEPLITRVEIIEHLKRFKKRKMTTIKLNQPTKILEEELRHIVY